MPRKGKCAKRAGRLLSAGHQVVRRAIRAEVAPVDLHVVGARGEQQHHADCRRRPRARRLTPACQP
eukprot:1442272-Alexandrium_andersonii.AAC.1